MRLQELKQPGSGTNQRDRRRNRLTYRFAEVVVDIGAVFRVIDLDVQLVPLALR
ncbi:MAG: hypothetical protein JOZ17_17460 [Acetobacteraceae bacterium]|nr:hypothetical protein [Acetobacteraceae bacterium]